MGGYAYKDYLIKASAGQTIHVELTSSKTVSVLTIFLSNGDNLEGAAEMNEFTGELPTEGNYVIRVLMMRGEARRSPPPRINFELHFKNFDKVITEDI